MSGRVRTLLPRQPAELSSKVSFSFNLRNRQPTNLARRVGFEPTSTGLKTRDPRPLDDRRLVDHQRIELCRQRSCEDRPRTQRIAPLETPTLHPVPSPLSERRPDASDLRYAAETFLDTGKDNPCKLPRVRVRFLQSSLVQNAINLARSYLQLVARRVGFEPTFP